jgi:hypothetical protein
MSSINNVHSESIKRKANSKSKGIVSKKLKIDNDNDNTHEIIQCLSSDSDNQQNTNNSTDNDNNNNSRIVASTNIPEYTSLVSNSESDDENQYFRNQYCAAAGTLCDIEYNITEDDKSIINYCSNIILDKNSINRLCRKHHTRLVRNLPKHCLLGYNNNGGEFKCVSSNNDVNLYPKCNKLVYRKCFSHYMKYTKLVTDNNNNESNRPSQNANINNNSINNPNSNDGNDNDNTSIRSNSNDIHPDLNQHNNSSNNHNANNNNINAARSSRDIHNKPTIKSKNKQNHNIDKDISYQRSISDKKKAIPMASFARLIKSIAQEVEDRFND